MPAGWQGFVHLKNKYKEEKCRSRVGSSGRHILPRQESKEVLTPEVGGRNLCGIQFNGSLAKVKNLSKSPLCVLCLLSGSEI